MIMEKKRAKMPDFHDQVVLVLGAGGGLGQAIVREFAGAGARLVLAARSPERLAELAQAVGGVTLPADLTDPASLEALSAAVLARFGRVDIVVNAAGYDVRKPLLQHSQPELERLVNINLLGAMTLSRVFLAVMAGGTIVHLGGFGDGRLAFPYYSADVASRAGVASFVEAVNREQRLHNQPARLLYFSPAPADTAAERPYHPIWRAMGIKIATPEQVAAELLQAVRRGKTQHMMGGALTVFFAKLNAAMPGLADLLMMNQYGALLKRHLVDGGPVSERPRRSWTFWLGIVLVVLSFVLYGLLPVLPFLPLSAAARLGLAPVLIAAGEAAFWVGGLLLGKAFVARMRGWWASAWRCLKCG